MVVTIEEMRNAALKLINSGMPNFASDEHGEELNELVKEYIKIICSSDSDENTIEKAENIFITSIDAIKEANPFSNEDSIRVIRCISNIHNTFKKKGCSFTNKQIPYMIYIMRLAKAFAMPYGEMEFMFRDLLDTAKIVIETGAKFNERIDVIQLYYVFSMYDTIMAFLAKIVDDDSAFNEYVKMLKIVYHIIAGGCVDGYWLHKLEPLFEYDTDLKPSIKSRKISYNIVLDIRELIMTVNETHYDISAIKVAIYGVLHNIIKSILNCWIYEVSEIVPRIEDYICNCKNAYNDNIMIHVDNLMSDIQCISEDSGDCISEVDTHFINGIIAFGTAMRTVHTMLENKRQKDAEIIYKKCIFLLEKLTCANTIKQIDDITDSIFRCTPSTAINKSINIGDFEPILGKTENAKACADENHKLSEREREILRSPDFCLAEPMANEGEDLEGLPITNNAREEQDDDSGNKPISWGEYFMKLAETAAMRSKDPRSKVGACIVDLKDNRVVSLGYNGFPYGCSDNEFPWTRNGEDNKYLYVVHAELNAIISAKRDLSGCALFVTYSPCNECMKAIIQSGIKKIVFKNEYKQGSTINVASSKMAKAAGVSLIKYETISSMKDLLNS